MSKPDRLPQLTPVVRIPAVQTCLNCVDLKAECERLQAELDRALKAVRREAHYIDSREPHRRR